MKFSAKLIGTASHQDCLMGQIFCAIPYTVFAFLRSRSLSVFNPTFMLKCTFVKISFSMPSMFILTFAFVSRFLSSRLAVFCD